MKHAVKLGLLVVGLVAAQLTFAAKVYTWTDPNGTTHYGERPPKDVKATLIHARTGHSEATPEADATAPAETAATTSGAQVMTQNAERCAQAQHNLEALKSYNRIKVKDEKGEMRVLSEAEKAQKIADMQKIADESC
jgi:hypothetical protein